MSNRKTRRGGSPLLNGSTIPKALSKEDFRAIAKKREADKADLVEKMHVPPRDEAKYPLPDQKDLTNAVAFLYTLDAVASQYDPNLDALQKTLHVGLSKCMRPDSTEEDLLSYIKTLTEMKSYLVSSGNPLFTPVVPDQGK